VIGLMGSDNAPVLSQSLPGSLALRLAGGPAPDPLDFARRLEPDGLVPVPSNTVVLRT